MDKELKLQKKREYMRQYYINHPEKLETKKEKERARYRANRSLMQEKARDLYWSDPERARATARKTGNKWRQKRRIEAIKFLGGKCADCGENNLIVLQFHHKDSNTKEGDLTAMATSPKKFWIEVEKCDLLCANCHLVRHFEDLPNG